MKKQVEQIRSITPGIKAKISSSPEGKAKTNGSDLITPDIIEKLPVVILTLAIFPTKDETQQLERWFRRNVDPQILLDIRQDPKIIGGCRIIWQGFEDDFSLRSKFRGRGRIEDRGLKTEDRIEN